VKIRFHEMKKLAKELQKCYTYRVDYAHSCATARSSLLTLWDRSGSSHDARRVFTKSGETL